MAGNIFHPLSSLELHDTNSRVKVRVTRMWPSLAGDGAFIGYNLILLDAQRDHMQAFVQADLWKSMGNIIVEGQTYDISNFITKEATGNYRPVHSALKIFFAAATMVDISLLNHDLIIPRHQFEIVQLPDLHRDADTYATDHTFAIDVIGVVDNLQPVQNMNTKFGVKSLITFRLCHGSYSFKVNIWGDLTESMNPLYEDVLETPVIVVLSSAKVGMYNGIATITNTPASKIYINLNFPDVFNFRNWLEVNGYGGPNND